MSKLTYLAPVILIALVWMYGAAKEQVGREKCASGIVKAEANKAEKRNEIRNNRPDTDKFFDGLRNDPDW